MIRMAVASVTQEITYRETAAAVGDNSRLIGQQRRRHGGRMRRDAGAEIEGCAIEMISCSSRAVAAALLQAIDMGLAKIPAARTLGEVAAERSRCWYFRKPHIDCL